MNINDILPRFTDSTMVLTPNRRLASFLNEKFNEWHISKQQTSWPSLKVFPLTEWLQQLWTANVAATERLLTGSQMEYLWREIITEHAEQFDLLKLDATAKQAIEALRMLVLWQVPLLANDFSDEADWAQFYAWQQAYAEFCTIHHVTDSFHLPKKLLDSINTKTWTKRLPKQIFIIGFDELPPLWESFINALLPFCEIIHADLTQTAMLKNRFEFINWREELTGMIQWAKLQQEGNPNQTIACIVPSLAKKRAAIEKAFIKAFEPNTFLELKDKDAVPFNISAGQALIQFDIVKTALEILQLIENKLSMPIIRFLLRNPFIAGYHQEYAKRAALEIQIAKLQTYALTQEFFLKQLQQHCPLLASQFHAFIAIDHASERPLLQWAEIMNQKLAALGWPGDRELSSQNYQLILRIKALFNELLHFDLSVNQCSYIKALELLQTLMSDTLFQVKTPKKNLQILGNLEAAGMIFDKIWIMEMNDSQWPAAANPNPYIPHRLQREHQLPHASPARELKFSQTLLQRYFNSAVEIYMSYAKEDEEQEHHCSSLIETIPLAEFTIEPQDLMQHIHASGNIETFIDTQAPAITATEMATIHGGTSILALQAACPFRSFATHRLQARATPTPEPGLTALERGKIIHAALDLFWQQVKTQAALANLSDENKQQIIASVVYAAILSINLQLQNRAPKLFKLELDRVKKLVNQWLDLELQREKFTVIATEHPLETHFSGLPLKLRIDRIDQLENGAIVLIDYKSNVISVNRWFGERPDEPQLPLYALIYPEPVEAVIFGQIKVNEFSIKGIGSLETAGFGIKNIADLPDAAYATWPDQKKHWQAELQKLAENFIHGNAEVDPKNGAQTCAFCDLASLCRIYENA